MSEPMTDGTGRVGLVLAGGGARGAYEAGVMTVLLPELERRGQRPAVIVGTSVGAINAVYLAANAHRPAAEVVAGWRERWLDVAVRRVVRPVLGPQAALTAARYAGAVAGLPGVRLEGLLDPSPLRQTLDRWIDWGALHRNARDGTIDCVAVVATAALTARSVVFLEGKERHKIESSHEIDYLPARLDATHVMASAAIPTLFPAVRVDRPARAREWYFDGGTRLNTPIKPVLDMGVDRVVIVGTHSIDPRLQSNWHVPGRPPDFIDGAVQLLFAALVDSLIEDVRMLGKINLLVRDTEPAAAQQYKRRRGKSPYQEIPYMFIAPPARDAIGDLAHEVFREHYTGLGRLRSPDMTVIARLLGGVTEPHGELLSYLFFSPEFAEALIDLGERDARAWLERDWGDDGPWLREPIDTLYEDASRSQ